MRNGKARARTSSGAALVTIGPRPMHQHSSLGGSDFLLACVPDIETICEDLGLGLCGVSGHLEGLHSHNSDMPGDIGGGLGVGVPVLINILVEHV